MYGPRLFCITLALCFVASSLIHPARAADVPERINYQGKLAGPGGVPLDGAISLEFKITDVQDDTPNPINDEMLYLSNEDWIPLIYQELVTDSEVVTDLTGTIFYAKGVDYNMDYVNGAMQRIASGTIPGGFPEVFVDYVYTSHPTPLWSETQTVNVVDGLFDVVLGENTPIPVSVFTGKDRFLEVVVDEEILLPRRPFQSVPYATKSEMVPDDSIGADQLAHDIDGESIGLTADRVDGYNYSAGWPTTQSNIQGALFNDFHNIGGVDDDQPDNDGEVPDNISINNGRLYAPSGGNVGVGTTSPGGRLTVNSAGPSTTPLAVTASDTFTIFKVEQTSGDAGRVSVCDDTGSAKVIINSMASSYFRGGNVGIGNVGSAPEVLTVRGNILVQSLSTGSSILELGEGLDYAEGFDVSDGAEVAPGTVLIIDPDTPGNLTSSTSAYDTRVAGIVAGAEGLGSGVRLGVDDFDLDVALAGRVYCKAEALAEAIAPGDLLTTSDLPGHAMCASDEMRRGGAILGKAMEGLPKGETGMILVLVTLQ